MAQQNYGQTQGYAPMQPRKSNKKLIAALIAIIVVVVVVIIIVLLLTGGSDSRFVGRWEQEGSTSNSGMIWNFKSDRTLELTTTLYGETTTTNVGNWEVRGSQLCGASSSFPSECINFEFSNNGNTLTLYAPGEYDYDLVLNKI